MSALAAGAAWAPRRTMRVVLASQDREAASWLQGVLASAGLTVAVLDEPRPSAPELATGDLLIADAPSAAAIGPNGPPRRLLLVPRGGAVDVARAMQGGFLDLVVVPSPEDEVLGRVGRALDRFLKPLKTTAGPRVQAEELRTIAERVAAALKRARPERAEAVWSLVEGMLSVFLLLIDSHETTDRATPGHSRRVAGIVRVVGRKLGLPAERAGWLELAARLHDIGLVCLDLPLKDAAPLSLELRRALAGHPRLGAEILQPLAAWGLDVQAVAAHHERVDGSGYPKGLQGEEVPLGAQILGAADAFEALTSPRPWRGAEAPQAALDAMRTGRGFGADVLGALEEAVAEGLLP